MVSKIVKVIFFFAIVFFALIFSFCNFKGFDTSLAGAILPKDKAHSAKIIKILNKNSNIINVIFEANNEDSAQEKKNDFIKNLDYVSFEPLFFDFDALQSYYSANPTNFLSYQTKDKIINKKYGELYNIAISKLYSPLGFQIVSFVDDPYFLLDDFIFSNLSIYKNVLKHQDKYYSYLNLKVKNPSKIKDLILSVDDDTYLSGNLVHSYYMSKSSSFYINLICILTTFLIVLITYFYFKCLKILIPLVLSIMMGFIFGYFFTNLLFSQIHIFTLLFSATLIGIGIDYCYHYMFSSKESDESGKKFIYNLTFSYLTTSFAFFVLYLSGIDLLKQISVFMIFGLLGIYLFVIFIFPLFKVPKNCKTYYPSLNTKILYSIILLFLFLSIFGVFKLRFDDSLKNIYRPSLKLKQAEVLNNLIINPDNFKVNFLVFEGKDIDTVLEKEEQVADILDKNDIKFISLSRFIPSIKSQKANNTLVMQLYKENLSLFREFLSELQIKELINKKPEFKTFPEKDFKLFNSLFLDENQTIMTVYSDILPENIADSASDVICIQDDISNYLKNYRIKLLKLLPFIYLILIICTFSSYKDFSKSFKVLFPIILSPLLTIFTLSFFNICFNLFSIISLFLVIGFTLDYSIFGLNGEQKSNIAIFVSCLTTSFSFLLLSFSSFKLIADIALILFLGVIFSYLSGLIFSGKK